MPTITGEERCVVALLERPWINYGMESCPHLFTSRSPRNVRNNTDCAFSPTSEGCLKRDHPFEVIHFSSRNGCVERITTWRVPQQEPPQMSKKVETSSSLSELFEILSHTRRRRILVAVAQQNPQDEDDITSVSVADEHEEDDDVLEQLKLQLHHNHLPKLADAGFVDWDRDSGTITRGPRLRGD